MHDATPQTRLEDLKAAHYNPRRATKRQRALLDKALKAFGDLGGIVFNKTTGNLVGGHQRVAAMRQDPEAKLVVTRELPEPTGNGTVAEGYVQFGGERYAYRQVRWDENTERLANLAANKGAGSFDSAMLADSLKVLSKSSLELTLSMFDEQELRSYMPDVSVLQAPEPEPEQTSAPPQDNRLRGATPPPDAPHAAVVEAPSMRQVTLTYREVDYVKFAQLVDALKDVYHVSNVSDVVLQAVQRAGVTAAFK